MSKATASVKDRFESYFNARHAGRDGDDIDSILNDDTASDGFGLLLLAR